jgi:putative membrane protein
MTDRSLPPLPERETLRLHQANERTLLAWIRTALGLMGFGFVVARFGLFLRELAMSHGETTSRAPYSLWLGLALSVAGSLLVVLALVRFRRSTEAIERHEVGAPGGNGWIYLVGGLVAVVGLAVAALLVVTS